MVKIFQQQMRIIFSKTLETLPSTGDPFLIKVARKDEKGVEDTVELKSVMTKFPKIKFNVLELADNPSQEQLLIRNAWLKPNNL